MLEASSSSGAEAASISPHCSSASTPPTRAREQSLALPASYAVFDVLAIHGIDVRARLYARRRVLLEDLRFKIRTVPFAPPVPAQEPNPE